MATISSTIKLVDQMSATLQKIEGNVDNQEYYIDNRTEYDTDFNYTVQPITYNSVAYVICCPNCGKLHPFPIGYGEQVFSNLWEDHIIVPELPESYHKDGQHYQIIVRDRKGIIGKPDYENVEADLTCFGRCDNPKVKEAVNLLFPDMDYSESIDPDAAEIDIIM